MSGDAGLRSDAIPAALQWIEAALTGSLATAIAIIAIGCFGMMLMFGRLSKRRGVQLVLGCFVVFGARPIAEGVVRSIIGAEPPSSPEAIEAPPPVLHSALTDRPAAGPYDPYAGAALPPRR
jgi:type IV secretory pathway VirB2 component (pilin)